MSIREIAGEGIPAEPVKPRKSQTAENTKTSAKDSVDVSGKAKSLYEAEQTKKLDDIREKVATGFYGKREVMEKVVDALLVDLKRP